jgi:hypothetical protein
MPRGHVIAGVIIMALAACAPRFDQNEFLLVASVKQQSLNGFKACDIDPYSAIDQYGSKTFEATQLYAIYSEHLLDNRLSYQMSNQLYAMADELTAKKGKVVSKFYCHEKFNNLTIAADRILEALAKKDR